MFVFSIHPRHVANILGGTKQYEYRPRRPSVKPGDTILIYETRPVSAVVGQATVTEVVDGCPCSTWQATSESGGVSSDEFFAYFGQRPRAVAIGLTDVVRFAEPVPVARGHDRTASLGKMEGAGCPLAEREMQDRTPQGCANCHTNIAAQWERSAHAAAWTNPEFVRQTRERSVRSCLSCHASLPLLEQRPGASPRLRDDDRLYGVECRTCHQLGEAYVGPYESRVGPHPVQPDTTRLPCSTFCGMCHEMEAEEHTQLYLTAEDSEGKTCVQCHMPTSRERLTQGHLLSYIHPKRTVHDHAFRPGPRASPPAPSKSESRPQPEHPAK